MTTEQYLALSQIVYLDYLEENWRIRDIIREMGDDTSLSDANKAVIPILSNMDQDNWQLINYENKNDSTGFAAMAFRNIETNEVVFTYRGTEQPTRDNITDAQLATLFRPFGKPNQYEDAFNFFIDTMAMIDEDPTITNPSPAQVTFTGHSLGGGMAQYMAFLTEEIGLKTLTNGRAVTFNAVGIAQSLEDGSVVMDLTNMTMPELLDYAGKVIMLSNVGKYDVTDYVDADDIVGEYGIQLGTTVYLQGTIQTNNALTALQALLELPLNPIDAMNTLGEVRTGFMTHLLDAYLYKLVCSFM